MKIPKTNPNISKEPLFQEFRIGKLIKTINRIKRVMQDKHGTWYAILSIRKEKHFVRCDSKEQTLYQRATLEKKYYGPIIKEYLEKKDNGGNEK